MLKKQYPQLNVYYDVRGTPIVNDVTIDDAKEVNMKEVANVISNGDGSLGTVLSRTSDTFHQIFDNANIVICKGQGNFKGLIDCNKENVYFLFMAKCHLISNITQTQ